MCLKNRQKPRVGEEGGKAVMGTKHAGLLQSVRGEGLR